MGNNIIVLVWGGFSLGTACLRRFFTLHFVLPLLVLMFVLFHLLSLHEYVSSSPVGVASGATFSGWWYKDLISFFALFAALMVAMVLTPWLFMDADNWFMANPMSTPEHIKPEWYFLFAYCVLRAIPDKALRVVRLVISLIVILISAWSRLVAPFRSFFLLTWLGGSPAEDIFILAGQIVTVSFIIGI
jgi:quinol-cytochrome oxidoreductase complex cytochrome b subunit